MEARRRIIPGLGLVGAIALTLIWAGGAHAYPTYRNTASPGTDDCTACHGDFRASPYVSPKGDNWGDDLHDVHRTTMLGADANRCNICHSAASRTPVYLNQSVGTTGFDPISCLGCHGRQGDRGVRPTDCADSAATSGPCGDGAGLRQHHWRAGETVCGGCHGDANPAGFTPVGENVKPPYYFTPDVLHPTKPTDPCNPPPFTGENFKGSTLGLDTDGDNSYDMADTDCTGPTPTATVTSIQTATRTPTPTLTPPPARTPTPTLTVPPTRTPTPTPTLTVAVTATPTVTPTPGALDHFTCYKAGATKDSVKFAGIPIPPGVSLLDQFGGSIVEVKKPKFLCAPTNKLGEDPTAPTHPEHLKGYQVKNPSKPSPVFPTHLKVVDQFNVGGLFVDAKKQFHLLVPTVKNRLTPPPLPGSFIVDHFQCYKVAASKGAPKFVPVLNVEIADQFGTMHVDVKKPTYLCTPVDKNGEDPTAPTHTDHLMCYQVKQVKTDPKFLKVVGVFVNNQFGPEQLDVKKPSELCVPAQKTL